MARTAHVGCAFCGTLLNIEVDIRAPRRDTILGKFKCPSCDSTFELLLKTLRRSKGKRFKSGEAAAKAEQDRRIAQAVVENDRIALQLLAQPGCTCAANAPNESTATYYDLRRDGLSRGGTGRDRIPLPPRHQVRCPCYDAAPAVTL